MTAPGRLIRLRPAPPRPAEHVPLCRPRPAPSPPPPFRRAIPLRTPPSPEDLPRPAPKCERLNARCDRYSRFLALLSRPFRLSNRNCVL